MCLHGPPRVSKSGQVQVGGEAYISTLYFFGRDCDGTTYVVAVNLLDFGERGNHKSALPPCFNPVRNPVRYWFACRIQS